MRLFLLSFAVFVMSSSVAQAAGESNFFRLKPETFEKMIKNRRIGNCEITVESSGSSQVRFNLRQDGHVYYDSRQRTHVKGPQSTRTIEINLTNSFGTTEYVLADYTGTLQLNGGSTVLFFDTRTDQIYRLLDFHSKTDGLIDCVSINR